MIAQTRFLEDGFAQKIFLYYLCQYNNFNVREVMINVYFPSLAS